VGDGTNFIDTVFVENAAQAHLMACDTLQAGSPVCGSAYFISQGEPVNCWEWINRLLGLAGIPPVTKSISTSAAWRIGATLEAAYRLARISSEPPMTRFLAAQLGRSHWFDISRAGSHFGYHPTVSTDEGLDRLQASWRGG
jgi:nucleoside-diphosphate-sugar epimerase